MSCKTARAELVLARYGELPPHLRRELDEHLTACAACAQERELLDRVLDAITTAPTFPREAEVDWARPLTCQAVRTHLSAYLGGDGDATGDGDLPAHLVRCPACATESAAISATLGAVRGAFPDEARVDWDAFAHRTARLAREADLPRARGTSSPSPAGRAMGWGRLLPVAASLAAAVAIGYLTLHLPFLGGPAGGPGPPPRATGAGAVETGALVASHQLLHRTRLELAKADAARYLADSRNLLLSFTGLPVPCAGDNVDVSMEREVSTRLLRRKQFLDQDLQDVEVARARRVANEVESLLAAIALLDNCVPPERVQEIRDLVGQRQLMMRIEMLTDELGPARGGRA